MTEPKKDPASKDASEEVSAEKEKQLREQKHRHRTERNLRNVEQYILSQNINTVREYQNSKKGLFNYKTFRQVKGNSSDIVTKLRAMPDLAPFFKLKNSTLSLIQPKIRIYRVTYEELAPASVEGGTSDGYPNVRTMDSAQRVPLPTPCYREFKFSDNFGNENAASVEDYLASESTKATWRNVGLQSFDFKQIGTSHGAIEHNIECNLKIKLKSLKDLTAQPPGEPPPEKGGLRYVDLVIHPGTRIDNETQQLNPMHYEIKVLLGYHSPTKDMIQNISTEANEREILESLEKMNMVLALSLRDYDFNISDDGSVTLDINYWGRIESVLNNSYANIFQETFHVGENGDLLYDPKANIKNNYGAIARLSKQILSVHTGMNTPSCNGTDCKAKKTLNKILNENELFKTIAKEEEVDGLNPTGASDMTKMYEWFKDVDNTNKLIGSLKSKAAAFRERVYQGFMAQIIDGNPQDAKGNGTRLFCASATKKDIQAAVGLINSAKEGKEKKSKIKIDSIKRESSTAVGEASKTLKIGRCSEMNMPGTGLAKVAEATAGSVTKAVEDESKSNDGKSDKKEEIDSSKSKTILDAGSDGDHNYYFVFLGDIIELACKNAGIKAIFRKELLFDRSEGDGDIHDSKDPTVPHPDAFIYKKESYITDGEIALDYPLTGVRLLLGPLEYYDRDKALQRINLAQFPIAFDLFREWFLQTIVKKSRIKMPIGTFITKIINQLVMPALSSDFIRTVKPRGTRTESISLSLPGRQLKGEKVKVCGRDVSRLAELLPNWLEIDVDSDEFKTNYFDKAKQIVSDESMIRTSFDYWLVQVSTIEDITRRTGQPSKDIPDGIFHFNIGSDRGLLKNMKFAKSKLAGLGEMRSLQALGGGTDQIAQLREVYDCNINLIGNSLFTPGMLFYANASLLGLGDPSDTNSLAYQLNLGGYFAIMETNMSIRPGEYITSLTGKQVGFGKKRGK